jgi:hypothetical protein
LLPGQLCTFLTPACVLGICTCADHNPDCNGPRRGRALPSRQSTPSSQLQYPPDSSRAQSKTVTAASVRWLLSAAVLPYIISVWSWPRLLISSSISWAVVLLPLWLTTSIPDRLPPLITLLHSYPHQQHCRQVSAAGRSATSEDSGTDAAEVTPLTPRTPSGRSIESASVPRRCGVVSKAGGGVFGSMRVLPPQSGKKCMICAAQYRQSWGTKQRCPGWPLPARGAHCLQA